jgi:heme-degrading monooxygenase HmoA
MGVHPSQGRPMIVTVFRSRLKPDNSAEYYETAKRMSEMARGMPGYVSHKAFTAEDGERVTIVEFADEKSQEGWRTRLEHLEVQKRGRKAFYSEYKLQVCQVLRESAFTAEKQKQEEPAR